MEGGLTKYSQREEEEVGSGHRGSDKPLVLVARQATRADPDQASLRLQQHHETYQTLNRPGADLDKRREEAEPPLLAPLKNVSLWYVGTSLLAQMSAHIL